MMIERAFGSLRILDWITGYKGLIMSTGHKNESR